MYKVIWHNQYSYMKAKVLRYRLRVLERKSQKEITSLESVDELFTINELNQKEELTYNALKQVYPDINPIIKIARPTAARVKHTDKRRFTLYNQTIEKSLTLYIEDNRCYLKLAQEGGSYVQQFNSKHLESLEYDSTSFFSEDSAYTTVYILTQLSGGPPNHKSQESLCDYIMRAEKCLYYTLEKLQFRERLHPSTEFFFSDACDTLMASALFKSTMDFVHIFIKKET